MAVQISVAEAVFWICAGVIVYTIIGYPLVVTLLGRLSPQTVSKAPITPSISFIIAAYNEEDTIAAKLRNTIGLDYDPAKREIIVASDGSTDRTDEIVRSFTDQGVHLCRTEGRIGKTETLNQAVKQSTGDIIVFSDATGVFSQDTLHRLVENFNDASVGCVGGYVRYRYGQDTTSRGFKAYQRFAVAIRRAETNFGSQMTVSGGIHAIRRELYIPLDANHSHDIMDAVHTVVQGYRAVYECDAVCLEDSRDELSDEFHSRVRIGLSAMVSISYILRSMLKRRRWGYLFQFCSHKLLRWWLWTTLVALLVTSALLAPVSPVYAVALGAQLGLYALAGMRLLGISSILAIPGQSAAAFFLLGNAAMCIATLKWLRGDNVRTWNPVR